MSDVEVPDQERYEVLDEFPGSRRILISHYRTPGRAASAQKLRGIIGRSRLYELFNNKIPDNHFSTKLQKLVINSVHVSRNYHDIFDWISLKTGHQNTQENLRICGKYKYWRYFPAELNQSIFSVRVGMLSISEENNCLVYRHRSANASNQIEWEDDGLAFVFGKRLYCIGFRNQNIRLLISHIPDHVDKESFRGMVLSTQSKTRKLFSASFAMFHETNKSNFDKTEDYLNKNPSEIDNLGLAEPYVNYKLMID